MYEGRDLEGAGGRCFSSFFFFLKKTTRCSNEMKCVMCSPFFSPSLFIFIFFPISHIELVGGTWNWDLGRIRERCLQFFIFISLLSFLFRCLTLKFRISYIYFFCDEYMDTSFFSGFERYIYTLVSGSSTDFGSTC